MASTRDLKKMFEKGKRRVRHISPKAGSWGANMLRSLGYSTMEVFEGITPNMASITGSSIEAAKNLKDSLAESSGQRKSLNESLNQNVYVGIGKEWFQNALEDLKSGKLYNQQRFSDAAEAAFNDIDLGFGDEDFDFDSDFGDDDFDSFEDDIVSDDGGAAASFSTKSKNGNTVTQVVMSNNIGPDSPIVQATETQTEVLIHSSDIATKTSIAGTQAMLQMVSKVGSDMTSLLSTINESVTDINTNTTRILSEHSTSAIQFYSDSMETQKSILEEIKGLRESMTTQIAATSTLRPGKESIDVLDMFMSGNVNLGDYLKFVKKNARTMADSNLFISQIMGMTSDTDSIKAMAANPLAFIPNAIIKGMIPSITRAAVSQLDKTIGEFAIGALTKLGSKKDSYDDPIGKFFGSLFGIQNEMRTTVDRSNYEKGQVPWDGIARRTLVDVIPAYLSQIAAAVTGTEQMVFDYDKGVYKSLRSIQNDREKMIETTKTSPFFDDISQFNEFANSKFTGRNQQDIQNAKDTFRKLVIENVNRGGGINYRAKDGDDQLGNVLGLFTGDPTLELIRSFFEGRHQAGDNAANIRFFGRSAQEARMNVTRSTERIEKDPIYENMQYLNNGLEGVDNSHIRTFKNGSIALRGTGGPNADTFGKRPAEYLRDILIRLNKGILVEVTNQIEDIGGGPGGRRRRKRGAVPTPKPKEESSIMRSAKNFLEKADQDESEYNQNVLSRSGDINRRNEYYDEDIRRGKVGLDDIDSPEMATAISQEYHAERLAESDKEEHGVGKRSMLSKLADKLPPGMRRVVQSVEAQFGKAGATVARGIGKVNDYLYSLIFGRDDGNSIMKDFSDKLRKLFGGFKTFMMDKILHPIDDALFGKEGFFTKIKDSEMMKDIKDIFGRAKERIFGTKTTDANGNTIYEGGLLSDTMTELRGMGDNVKTAIFGDKKVPLDKDNSVFGHIKRMGKQVGDSISAAVGLKNDDADAKPLSSRIVDKLDDVWLGVQDRFSEWSNMILGPEVDDKGKNNFIRQGLSSFGKDMKGQGGAIGAGAVVGGVGLGLLGSHVGFLSSIFLPGGPIGGALLGAGIAMVNKSETLKTMLFGPEEDGERTGGLVTKEIVDFAKDNKKGIVAGGFLGLAGSMGLIPAMFVPGGPIGGAIIGGALSMATKTEVFQEFLYGEGGTKDDPTGGLMKKFQNVFGKDKDLKGLGLNAGIGAGVGLIGSFFLPGGPIIGSLIGAAASVAMNTEKFKTFMFGEEQFDEDGDSLGRKGGLFGKVTNFVSEKIFSPLADTAKRAQIKMIGFVEREMIAPLLSALSPITNKLEEIGLNMKEGFSGFFRSIGDKFNEVVTKPIGDALEPYIDKMKSVLSKIFGGLFKAIGAVISSPFKMIGAVGKGIFESDKRRGANAATSDELDKILDFKGRRERGERMGLFGTTVAEVDEDGNPTGGRTKVGRGLLGSLVYAYSKENRMAGAYSDKGAGRYATSEKNPYTIEQDFIAKSKAREAERLAKLGSGRRNPMGRFRQWLDEQNPVQDSKVLNRVDPKEFRDVYDSLVSAGVPNAAQLALEQFGIETNDPDGAIKRLLRGKGLKKEKTPRGKKGKNKVDASKIDTNVGGEKLATESTTTKISDVITIQTDIETEHHKEKISIFENIRDKFDTLLDKLDIQDRVKRPKENASPDINIDASTTTRPVDEIDTDIDSKLGRSKGSLLSKIYNEVDKISDSVYGQLNGVGSNINKIYRLLLKLTGHSDDDIKGDNNKEYVGFFGKIRTMLNNPIKAVMNILMTPVRLIEAGFNKVNDIVTGIGSVLKQGAKSLWEGTKAFVGGIAQAGLSLIQLPVQAMKMLGTVLKNVLPVAKELLVGGIKTATAVVTEGIHVAGAALVEGVHALGTLINLGAEGLGHLIGGALSGLGSLLGGLGLVGKEALKGLAAVGKGVFKFGAGLIGGAMRFGSTLIGNAIGGIFGNKEGRGLFPKTMDVYVVGGTLDEVVLVKESNPEFNKNLMKNLGIYFTRISDDIFALRGNRSSGGNSDGEPPLIPIENASSTIAANMGMPGFSQSLGFGSSGGTVGSSDWLGGITNTLFDFIARKKKKKDEDEESEPKPGTTEAFREAASIAAGEAEDLERHEGMMGVLSEILDVNKEQHTNWLSIFGRKKGLISLGLLAAIPLIIRGWPIIKDIISKIASGVSVVGEWLGNIFASLPESWRDSGGGKGVVNNAKELYDNFGQLIDGEKTQTVINDDGTVGVVTDDEGNVIDVAQETVSTGGPLGRIKNFIMPERAKIDIETGEAYRERTISGVSLAYIKRKFMKSGLMKSVKRGLGNKLLQGEIAVGKAIGKGVSKLAQSAPVQGLVNAGKTLGGKAVSKLASVGKGFVDDAAVKIAKVLGRNPDDAIKTVSKLADSSGLIKDFIGVAKDFIVKFADDIAEFLASKGVVGSAVAKALGTIKSYIGKITAKVCMPFLDKIKSWFAKAATSASTAFLAELGFGAIGAIVANPAQVFGVNKKDVNVTMQIIARFMKGLLSTSLGSIADLVNQIIYYVFGFDFVGEACVVIYNLIAGPEGREELKKAKESFLDEYHEFSQKEYDAYARKAQESGQPVMSKEEFQASDLATSRSQYNEQQNPDLVQRAINGASKGFNWVKRKIFGGKGGDEVGGFGEGDEGDTTSKPVPDTMNGMPYFSQNDPNYKNLPYNLSDGTEDTISSRGCGPTAMAMIGKAYGAKTDPVDMANMATRGGYSTEVGTVPKFFEDASSHMGLKSERLPADQQNVSTALAGGTPILLQGQDEDPNSPYTSKGHYVVGTRLASGAGIAINDPRGPEYSGVYPMDKVLRGARNMWVFGNGQSIPSMEETGGFGIGDAPMTSKKTILSEQIRGVTAEKVIKVAANEVGYIEKASNSQLDDKTANPGENNYTKYNKCVGSNPQFWCAAFVCWCFEEAAGGDAAKVKQLLCGSKSAACNTLMSQFKSAGRFDNTPKLGDCIFFSGTRHGGANHIAIVVGIDSSKVYTIEGNTTGSAGVVDNGGEVAFKQYELGASRILGYGHPVFDAETNFAGIVGEGQLAASASGGSTSSTVVSDSASSSSSSGSGFLGMLSNLATGIGNIYMKAFGFNVDDGSSGSASSIMQSGASNLLATATGDAPLTGNSVEEQVWNYFTSHGFTKEATAGIMGNIWQESKFKPDAIQHGSGHAAGLFQWESYKNKAARWANLNKLAQSVGKDWTDLGTQLDFGHSEMQNEKWMWKTAGSGMSTNINSFDQFKALKNVEDATHEFEVHFERAKPESANMPERKAMAQKYYDTYKNMVPGAEKGTTNMTASNAGLNVATLRAEGGSSTTKPVSSGSSLFKTLANNSSTLQGMGGFGDGGESTKALGVKLGLTNTNDREMYAAPLRVRDSYGGFGSATGDGNARVIELLDTIASETGGINSGVRTLNDKEIPAGGNTQNVYNITGGNKQVNNNIKGTPSKGIPFTDDLGGVGADYSIAKQIAKSMLGN